MNTVQNIEIIIGNILNYLTNVLALTMATETEKEKILSEALHLRLCISKTTSMLQVLVPNNKKYN